MVERAEAPEPFIADLRGGWREVRARSWVWSFLLAMVVYHVIVLPSICVLGPVLFEDELDGATSWAVVSIAFGLGSIVADVLLLRWRPRFALRAAASRLGFASCQAVIIGSGLPIAAIAGARVLRGDRRLGLLHALGDVAAGAHPGGVDLARDEL